MTPERRRGPTWSDLTEHVAKLPPDQAQKILDRARPAPSSPEPEKSDLPAPAPTYASWDDYLSKTTQVDRRRWCTAKAKKASDTRLMSGRPATRITTDDVWSILEGAQGRCMYCGSLAVERRPSKSNGAPLPWEHVGRRIGSLSHRLSRFEGGDNASENLAWSCLWCNTWPSERTPEATDHGGLHPHAPDTQHGSENG